MPSNIQLPSATFANPLIHTPPTITGLVNWTFFGGSAAQSAQLGSMGGIWNIIGAPVFQPNYVSCLGNGNGLQSSVQHVPNSYTNGVTILLVSRNVVGGTLGATAIVAFNAPGFLAYVPISNTAAATGIEASIAGTPNPLLLGPGGTPPVTIDGGKFKFYAVTGGKNTIMNLYDLTDSYVSTGTAAANIASATAVNIILGGNSITAGANDRRSDIAFYAMYNSILTKPQIDQTYAAVKDLLLLRPGTPIVI